MHRINLAMQESNSRAYYINLDPAVRTVPFAVNIDIRDTVNYKEVMSEYQLGPNGGILTSLNLFATRFDQVIGAWTLPSLSVSLSLCPLSLSLSL
jgi:GPN-loop GTPase